MNIIMSSRAPPYSTPKNTADVDIFVPIAPFRRTSVAASSQIDENWSLPYKPRQLSAMTRFDRERLFWAGNGRFEPVGISGLISLSGKLPGQRRTTREADLSTQQTGTQAPSRLPRPPCDGRRPQGPRRPPRAGPQAPERLSRASRRYH